MPKVDMELKKAFGELQLKAVETAQKVKITDMQIDALTKKKYRSLCTEAEIASTDANCKMYESVGRMFVLTPKDDILNTLKKERSAADEKIATLENNKTYMERNMKEAENNIREMVQQRK